MSKKDKGISADNAILRNMSDEQLLKECARRMTEASESSWMRAERERLIRGI